MLMTIERHLAAISKIDFTYSLNERMDRTIIEGLHDIVSVLEDNLKTLVKAELSVLVDILYRPELLFPTGTEARRKCENGGFIKRLINHTSKLFEEKQDFLCVKILGTLREMMATETDCGDKGEQLVMFNFDSLHVSFVH